MRIQASLHFSIELVQIKLLTLAFMAWEKLCSLTTDPPDIYQNLHPIIFPFTCPVLKTNGLPGSNEEWHIMASLSLSCATSQAAWGWGRFLKHVKQPWQPYYKWVHMVCYLCQPCDLALCPCDQKAWPSTHKAERDIRHAYLY